MANQPAPPLYFIRRPPNPATGKTHWDWVGGYNDLALAKRVLETGNPPGSFIVEATPLAPEPEPGTSPWAWPVPSLDIDVRLGHPTRTLDKHHFGERQAVAYVLDNLATAGFVPMGQVLDALGGEESGEAHDTKTAMEVIFNLDEARVYMRDRAGRDVGTLAFIRGNSPAECLADWSWKKGQEDEPEGFHATLERITKTLWASDD